MEVPGIITFVTDRYETEFMHLYTADDWEGEMIECNEGNLEWLDKKEVFNLKVWEGDKIFFWLMQHDAPFFSLRLEYVGDELVSYSLNGIYHRQKAEGQSMYQEFLDTYRRLVHRFRNNYTIRILRDWYSYLRNDVLEFDNV